MKKMIKKTNIFNKLNSILNVLYKKFEIKSSELIPIVNPRKIANRLDISTINPLEKPLKEPYAISPIEIKSNKFIKLELYLQYT